MTKKIPLVREITLPNAYPASLVWQGDTLVDWANGGGRYNLDGSQVGNRFSFRGFFDTAVATSDGDYAVVYTKLNTKAVVLRNGQIIREIDRSYYCADEYEYPVALTRLNNGRAVIIHCPDAYNRLEIDDVLTGKRLTSSKQRKPSDIFHSRLSVSPDGRYLLDAGWVWHPADTVRVFDIQIALSNPSHLDGHGLLQEIFAEESSATFAADNRLIVALKGLDLEGDEPGEIRVHPLTGDAKSVPTRHRHGTVFSVTDTLLLALYEHPHLVDLASGDIVQRWPHISSGVRTSSIMRTDLPQQPPLAWDSVKRRLAVAGDGKISVLLFDEA